MCCMILMRICGCLYVCMFRALSRLCKYVCVSATLCCVRCVTCVGDVRYVCFVHCVRMQCMLCLCVTYARVMYVCMYMCVMCGS